MSCLINSEIGNISLIVTQELADISWVISKNGSKNSMSYSNYCHSKCVYEMEAILFSSRALRKIWILSSIKFYIIVYVQFHLVITLNFGTNLIILTISLTLFYDFIF